jgi:hypothetical protein
MKYDHREISELSDLELVQAYQNCLAAEHKRLTASQHEKFKTMEFPPISPIYLEMKNAIHDEMNNRKLEIEK